MDAWKVKVEGNGVTLRNMEKDNMKRVKGDQSENQGRGSNCGSWQDSMETVNMQPYSPVGERDDDEGETRFQSCLAIIKIKMTHQW